MRGDGPVWLNKRTGWESRTVPPLYACEASHGESRSLERALGRRETGRAEALAHASQKTYEVR